MKNREVNARITARGKEFFESIKGETPSVFNKELRFGKVLDWSMKNEDFKVQIFRFVDVFPCLTTGELLTGHIKEYFGGEGQAGGFDYLLHFLDPRVVSENTMRRGFAP